MTTQLRSADSTKYAQAVADALRAGHRYLDVRVLPDGSVASLVDLLYTRAIHLGCTLTGWGARFCFADRDLATKRFNELKSEDDEPAGYTARR